MLLETCHFHGAFTITQHICVASRSLGVFLPLPKSDLSWLQLPHLGWHRMMFPVPALTSREWRFSRLPWLSIGKEPESTVSRWLGKRSLTRGSLLRIPAPAGLVHGQSAWNLPSLGFFLAVGSGASCLLSLSPRFPSHL